MLTCLLQLSVPAPDSVEPIAGAGSNRRYFRLSGAGKTLIGVNGTDRRENEAFVYLSRHFRQSGLPVPEVVAVSSDGMSYFQQDLGSTSLFDLIREGDDDVRRLLSETMRLLPDLQFGGGRGLDYSRCYPQSEFDARTVMWDLNYFKYCFLKPRASHSTNRHWRMISAGCRPILPMEML